MQTAAAEVEKPDLSFDLSVLFAKFSERKRARLEKKQRKFTKPSEERLKQLLGTDETIYFSFPSVGPTTMMEWFTTGWILTLVKRSLFVVTTRRILCVPLTYRGKPRNTASQILYGDLAKIKSGINRLKLTYKSGKRETFQVGHAKKIRAFVETQLMSGERSQVLERQHLCPRCLEDLRAGVYKCRRCQLTFKDKETALRLSLLLPGGGYFYTRHPLLGVADFMVELYLILIILFALFSGFGSEQGGGGGVWFIAFFLTAILVIEKLITIYHAKHYVAEFIPEKKDFSPASPLSSSTPGVSSSG